MTELNAVQLLVIGAIASLLAQGLKLLLAWKQIKLDKDLVSIVAMIISGVLAYIWLAPRLILPPDPMDAANLLLNQAGAVLGAATLIYNVLLQRILEKLNLGVARFLPNT